MAMKSRTTGRMEWRWGIGASLAGVCAALSLAADENKTPPPPKPAPGGTNAPSAPGTNAPAAAGTNAAPAAAAEASEAAEAPEPLTPEQMFEGGTNTYSNWIDFGFGGFWTGGDRTQAQASRRAARGLFGGIEDFRYQQAIKKATLTIDGRALADQKDYKLSLDLRQEELGYLRLSYDQFRTWSNGDGGYYPPTDQKYPLSGDVLALDRGSLTFEGGLTYKEWPQIRLSYNHAFRDGDKASTAWGITHPDLNAVQGLAPSVNRIDEHSDSLQIDVSKTIKVTEVGVGIRYDTGQTDDSLRITHSPNEPGQQRVTDSQKWNYDLFNVHAYTESRLWSNVVLSAGYAYSGLDNDFSGSRIYGARFGVPYAAAAQNGAGYYGLNGGSRLDQNVINLNLMYRPTPVLSIVPSLRVQQETLDASAREMQTLAAYAPVPRASRSDSDRFDVRERLDVNYTGLTNSTLYARGEWTEGSGDLTENGGLGLVNGIGVPTVQRQTDDSRFFQKYSAGARWYPARRTSVDVGGEYQDHHYDFDHNVDSTPNDPASANRYPAYLVMQDIETLGGKARLSIRPWQNVTLVSRYEYQFSTIDTQPASASGLGTVESSEMRSHVLAQDASWTPWYRLTLQAGINYVHSTTTSPGSRYTRAVLDAQNNYWVASLFSSFVVDDKTDLNLGYLYYRADDYKDNSAFGVPYGAGAEEHSISVGLTRRIRSNLRVALRYAFYDYTDELFGGRNDYHAHMASCTLRYLF